ncbi:hypothetical protein PPECC33_01356 [Escherichia coli PCN033]|nr:hypothetical protein PPECC33_01356 [Escherichia coli PCN033]
MWQKFLHKKSGKKLKGRLLNSYARVGARRYDNWKLKLGQQDI